MSSLEDLVLKFSELKTEEAMPAFSECAENTFSIHSEISFTSFTFYMEELCKQHSTIKFWYNFVMEDCFTHVALYIGKYYRVWHLWVVSLKLMAPVFQAFPSIQRILHAMTYP